MRLSRFVQAAGNLANAGVNALYPPVCARCGQPDVARTMRGELESALCENCQPPMSLPLKEMCPRCATVINQLAVRDGRCPRCREVSFAYDRILCLGPYRGELGAAIVRMKNIHEQPLAYAMGRMIGQRVLEELRPLPDILVPMPIHCGAEFGVAPIRQKFWQKRSIVFATFHCIQLACEQQG